MQKLTPKKLTQETFSRFGDVIEMDTAKSSFPMNYGLATRYCDIGGIDVSDEQGETCISLVRSNAITSPFKVKVMEYHPLGSQLFYPLCEKPFLILVAQPADILDLNQLELFMSNGQQGVNYHKSVWHHYLMPTEEGSSDFIVVDRKADDENCIMSELKSEVVLVF